MIYGAAGYGSVEYGGLTPTVSGVSLISGTTSLAFSVAGAVTGEGAIAGATSLSFATAGSVAGTGAVAGATSLAFTVTGTITGTGAIAGTTSLTFTATWNNALAVAIPFDFPARDIGWAEDARSVAFANPARSRTWQA